MAAHPTHRPDRLTRNECGRGDVSQPNARDRGHVKPRAGAYYNDTDPYVAQWLRNQIDAGLIPAGEVDERSISDVHPDDLKGFVQCHFFAGLGGWPWALKLAGWPSDRPVWTGSCPCQPFSVAGAKKGFDDKRHLWPEFKRLIEKRCPATVFGEQVAGASRWLGLVRSDLEAMGYAVGAMPIEAASADADHFRDRYWFVADYDFECAGQEREQRSGEFGGAGSNSQDNARAVVDAQGFGWGEGWTEHEFRSRGFTAAVANIDGSQFLECSDTKWRRLPPPRVRWLGTRLPARISRVRAFGNAIDPRPASAFVAAFMECRP